jgi:hypothetical protein
MEVAMQRPTTHSLGLYASAMLEEARRTIRDAPKGAQSDTLAGQAWAIGFLAGIRAVPQDVALADLCDAAAALGWNDPPEEALNKVLVSFNQGLRQGWRHVLRYEKCSGDAVRTGPCLT